MKKALFLLALALLLTIPSFAAESKADLLKEEWLAQDLYKNLYEETGDELYNRIYQAELQHETALRRLYGMNEDSIPERVPSELPKDLEERKALALQLEKEDIEELKKAAEATSDAREKRVFTNLAKASENHLAALLGEKECPESGLALQRQRMNAEGVNRGKGTGLDKGQGNRMGMSQGNGTGLGQGQGLNCADCEYCSVNQ